MKEGKKPEYPEKTPGDELQKMPQILQQCEIASLISHICLTVAAHTVVEQICPSDNAK